MFFRKRTTMHQGVSFYIMTYNQEAFAASAVEAAFAQDYPGLEIVISDDNSTDRTWDIIVETVEKCQKNNPLNHTVRLNRNSENLGICNHINKIVSLCTNDIIVCSAGDDISNPDRVSKSVAAFSDPEVMLVSSLITYIDENGKLITDRSNKRYETPAVIENIVTGKALTVGCAIACRRECYNFLNRRPLPPECSYEDVILALRACLLGRIAQIKEPLVAYRISENSLTNFDKSSPAARQKKDAIIKHSYLAARAQLDDFEFFLSQFPDRRNAYRKIHKLLVDKVDRKLQSYWIIQYDLPTCLKLKLSALFKGKNFFRFLSEALKRFSGK